MTAANPERSPWLDVGNGERSCVLTWPEQPTNYQALHVRPWPNGRFRHFVNGAYRGDAESLRAAERAAIRAAQRMWAESETPSWLGVIGRGGSHE